jgi:HSP20 family protein
MISAGDDPLAPDEDRSHRRIWAHASNPPTRFGKCRRHENFVGSLDHRGTLTRRTARCKGFWKLRIIKKFGTWLHSDAPISGARAVAAPLWHRVHLFSAKPISRKREKTNYLREPVADKASVASDELWFQDESNHLSERKIFMSLIRYQSPEISAWPSFDRWATLRDEMNSLFELPLTGNFTRQTQLFSGWAPALDLYQNSDAVIAVVEVPGMRKEDIDISLQDGMLTIAGERARSSGEGDNAERTERFSGKFRRSITLPTRVDAGKVSATYKDGILTVTLPKAEEAKPKKVEVTIE